MLHVKEFDEDPALLLQQINNEVDDNVNQQHPHYLLAVDTSIPRREFHVEISPDASSSGTSSPPLVVSTSHTAAAPTRSSASRLLHTPKQVLVDLFLPLGFPHSVDPSYLPYQWYDSLQGLCSYLRGVVSTSAVLTAAGVGNAEATAMGAAMTWAMKDGLGMIGGLLFSYVASPYFDAYVLEFRLFADFINNVALTLDMMAPLVPPSWLLALMSLSTLSKTMCGMSAGATKSSITCHLALEGNMADLNAKEGTQETLVSLLGMMMGVQLAKYLEILRNHYRDQPMTLLIPEQIMGSWLGRESWNIPVEFAVSWCIFLALTWLHMWSNYRGVKLLKLKSVNRERAAAILDGLVTSLARQHCENSNDKQRQRQPTTEFNLLIGPNEVEESMLRATWTLLFPRRQPIALDVSLMEVLQSSVIVQPLDLLQEFEQEKYIVGVNRSNQVVATMRTGANKEDELQAFVHCLLLRKCLDLQRSTKEEEPFTLELIQGYVHCCTAVGPSGACAMPAGTPLNVLLLFECCMLFAQNFANASFKLTMLAIYYCMVST